MIQCKICGEECSNFKSLSRHLKLHEISSQEYFDKYRAAEMSNFGRCEVCGQPTKFLNLNLGYRRYCSKKCSQPQVAQLIDWQSRNQKAAATKLERYGSATYNNAEKRELTVSKRTPEEIQNITEKRKATNIERYGDAFPQRLEAAQEKRRINYLTATGYDHPSKNPEVKAKAVDTFLEKYGVPNPSQSPEIVNRIKKSKELRYGDSTYHNIEKMRATNLKRYGTECCWGNHDVRAKCRQRYKYENATFDSSWELALFIKLSDEGVAFKYQPDTFFEYTFEDKVFRYFPDFQIGDQWVEIKGDQFFEGDKMINPFDRSQDALYEAKHQCMLQNNVQIWRRNEMKNVLNYIKLRYGKRYLMRFKEDE